MHWRSDIGRRNFILRSYSSEGDGSNASEDKPVVVDCGKENIHKENSFDNAKNCNAHACLGEYDQKEWLKVEKLAIENRKKETPFITLRERIKKEISRRIVPWEKIAYRGILPLLPHEHTKDLRMECTVSHLRHKKFTADYGARLTSSSGRILLQSIPGMELYRERMVRALARDLQVPIIVLDGGIFSSIYESESNEDNSERTFESEIEDENDASNEEYYTSSDEERTDGSDDEVDIQASAEALRKLLPEEKRVNGES